MKTKTLYIDEDLHAEVKATAALSRISIKDWVEGVLRDALAGRPSPSVLIDSKGRYIAQEEQPCSP
ncbi:MAG: hypothetical protein GWN58_25795 [Anaerolineae bacterium]|nr:hypothetical protein [Anaerolineae bacterium]